MDENNQIITARGTADGLVIRLDGRTEPAQLEAALVEFMSARRAFLSGNEVTLEWVGREPEPAVVDDIARDLQDRFDVRVRETRLKSATADQDVAESRSSKDEMLRGMGVLKGLRVSEVKVSVADSSIKDASLREGTGLDDEGDLREFPDSLYGRKTYFQQREEQGGEERNFLSGAPGRSVSLFDGVEALSLGEGDRRQPVTLRSDVFGGGLSERHIGQTAHPAHGVGGEQPEGMSPGFSRSFSGTRMPGEGALGASGMIGGSNRLRSTGELPWDDADARIVYATLRSGQKIETDHSLVIFGDVNSGAEIVAGGDIIVLGVLRGVAHAGAYDETGGGRCIFAVSLQPTQLRIGSVISRGSGEVFALHGPEVARVEAGLIVVQPYQSQGLAKAGAAKPGPNKSGLGRR